VYPNPVRDVLSVSCPTASTIYLTDLRGVLLKKVQTNSDPEPISMGNLFPGMYLVSIITKDEKTTQKIQVVR